MTPKPCDALDCAAPRLPHYIFCRKHMDAFLGNGPASNFPRRPRKADPVFAQAVRDGIEYGRMQERAERLGII